MRRRDPIRLLAPVASLALLACEGESPSALTSGTLEVATVTTGHAATDTYTVRVDEGASRPIGLSAALRIVDLSPGEHRVLLELPDYCTAAGENPRTVTVTAGETVGTEFQVACTATGSLLVTTRTTGRSRDPNGYLLVAAGLPQRVDPEAEVLIEGLVPGRYTVGLSDVAPNCTIAEGQAREVAVTAGTRESVSFEVACAFVSAFRWDTLPLPSGFRAQTLGDGRSIWGTSPSDLFVIGEFEGRGAILHYDGREWTEQAGLASTGLTAIAGSSSTNVFVVGRWASPPSYSSVVLHYDGGGWSEMAGPVEDPTTVRYRDIWVAPGGEAFLSGSIVSGPTTGTELIARHGGIGWSKVQMPGEVPRTAIRDVSGTSATDVWTIGWDWSCDECSDVSSYFGHSDGVQWTLVRSERYPYYRRALPLAPNDVWVVGHDYGSMGLAVVAHWDGATWTEGPPLAEDPDLDGLDDVWGSSSSNVYAVGPGNLLHFDGSSWSKIPGLGGSRIWGTSPDDIYLLGEDHVIQRKPW